MKTIKLSEKGQIAIPKIMREELHLKRGARLLVIRQGNELIIKKQEDAAKKLNLREGYETMLASQNVLAKEWGNKYDDRWDKY